MKSKSIFRDSSFWSLLAINLFILFYYLYYGTSFKTLVWVYWCQSVIIGFFNFLNLATIKNTTPDSMTVNEPITGNKNSPGCLAAFFAVHYGGFHLGYFIFIFTITDIHDSLDWNFLKTSAATLIIDQAWNFIRAKKWQKTHKVNATTMFFLPYLRIVPMHLTILLPAFLKSFSHLTVFLVLKIFADMATYVVSVFIYGKAGEPGDPYNTGGNNSKF